jgi:hypothetical protein
MLAVTLGHLESARTLLQHATNVNTENREGWTGIVFIAVCAWKIDILVYIFNM